MTAHFGMKADARYIRGNAMGTDGTLHQSEKLYFAGCYDEADKGRYATDYESARFLTQYHAPKRHEENGVVVEEFLFSTADMHLANQVLLLREANRATHEDAETYRAERDKARRTLDYMWVIVPALLGTVLAFGYFTWL